MYKIKNTAFDRLKATQHRTASKFQEEPSIAGKRLRRGETMELTDEVFKRIEKDLRQWEKDGTIDIIEPGEKEPEEQNLSAPAPTPPERVEPQEPPSADIPTPHELGAAAVPAATDDPPPQDFPAGDEVIPPTPEEELEEPYTAPTPSAGDDPQQPPPPPRSKKKKGIFG